MFSERAPDPPVFVTDNNIMLQFLLIVEGLRYFRRLKRLDSEDSYGQTICSLRQIPDLMGKLDVQQSKASMQLLAMIRGILHSQLSS